MTESAGTILALDVGTRRIGVAISDEERMTANPLLVLERTSRDKDIAALRTICVEHRVTLLVVGLPLASGETVGESAAKAMSLGKRLARAAKLPVEFVDEAESTVEATEALLEADMSRDKRRKVVDKVAAAIILRRWLEGQ